MGPVAYLLEEASELPDGVDRRLMEIAVQLMVLYDELDHSLAVFNRVSPAYIQNSLPAIMAEDPITRETVRRYAIALKRELLTPVVESIPAPQARS